MTFDDSALIHGGVYDPQKAREYYLRTRKLKGRGKSSTETVSSRSTSVNDSGQSNSKGNSSNSVLRDSRREDLVKQRDALNERLDKLKEVLKGLVDAAKKRSGADDNTSESSEKTKSTKDSKSGSTESEKPSKLTEAEKREKRKASKVQYEKENRTTLAKDVDSLQRQIAEIRAKIEKAITDARDKQTQSNNQTASNGR